MTKTTELGIFNLLERLAVESGEAIIQRACKKFLRKKTVSGVKPTPRKRIPRAWVLEALDQQNGTCSRCGNLIVLSDLVGDHRIPLIQGGHHNKWNIQAMHRSCNASKGSNSPLEESKTTGRTILEQLQ